MSLLDQFPTAIVPGSGAEGHLDKYFGEWLIGHVGPVWQGATSSYKGGSAVVFGGSRDEVLEKIDEFIKTHDRILATDALADRVQTASAVVAGVGALTLAGAYYGRDRFSYAKTVQWAGGIAAALGAIGLGSVGFLRQAAAKNRGA
jgi:hypothetical protein